MLVVIIGFDSFKRGGGVLESFWRRYLSTAVVHEKLNETLFKVRVP